MICQQCRKPNDPDAAFCVHCSHPLQLTCPACRTQNTTEARYCKQCGAELGEVVASAQSARLQDLQASAPQVLREKLRAAEVGIEGQRKPVTILFADIVGSTALAEGLDPEEWKEVLQGAHHRVSEAIHRYEGTIAQLLGDGVMAFFGAPLTHEDDPERAVRAGLDLQESIADYRRQLRGFVDAFHMRVGIHTGEVVVGPVGTDERTEYLAVGDAVNIAARLEGAAQPDQVLVSAACARFIGHRFELGPEHSIEAKGKSEPVAAAVVLGLKAEPGLARGLGGLRTPFVGREAELAALRKALLALCGGQGRVVTVVGEAGIGKTRLLERACETLEQDQPDAGWHYAPASFRWLEGRALSYGGSLPFWTINQLLLDDLGLGDGSPQVKIRATLRKRLGELFEAEETQRILPTLAHLLGLPLEGPDRELIEGMDGESIKLQTLMDLTRYFERLAESSPAVVVLEDLHWADPSSLEALKHLLPLTDRAPLCFVLLMRMEPDHPSWALKTDLGQTLPHRVVEIQLHRLGEQESQQLVAQLLRPDVMPEDLRQLILTRSEGNPFYLEEVVRHLLESELIVEQDGEWIVSERIAEVGLPETLQGVLLARIDRLEEDVRATLQTASVIGKSFLFTLLQAIAAAERELDAHLTQLQRVDLVREKARLPQLEYIFKHSLTQEAAYNSLLIERRRAFHLKVGEAIEALFPDRVEEFLGLLAHHFEAGDAGTKAGEYLARAGLKALDDAAIEEGFAYFRRALAIYEKVEDPLKIAGMHHWMGLGYWASGDREASLEHLHLAHSILEGRGETVELAWVLCQISRMHMLASEHDLAIEWGERALALAERLGDVEIRAHTLNNLGSTYCGQGELEAGLALLRESLDVSLEADMRSPITRAYFNIGCFLRAAGRYEQAYENAQAHREYAVRNSVHLSDAMANQAMATVEWYWGRWGEALDRIPAISAGVAGIFNVWAHTFYGWMDNDLGRASNARQDLERLLPLAISSGEIQTTVPYLGQLARAYALLGRDEDAARTIGQILDLIDATPFYHEDSAPALLLCGRWYAARGDPASIEACRASVDRLRKAYDQLQFPETQALFEEARGHLALAEGRVADAVDHFESAAEIWESLERPYDRARTLGDLGHAQLAAADPTAAAEAYDQALDLLGELEQQLDDELGAAFHDAQMVREIRQARASL